MWPSMLCEAFRALLCIWRMEGGSEPLGVGGARTILAFPGIISARLMQASTRLFLPGCLGRWGRRDSRSLEQSIQGGERQPDPAEEHPE